MTKMAEPANRGWTPTRDWMGEVSATMGSYYSARLCLGGCLTPETANAWWWTIGSATRSWRRDLQEMVSSLFFGLTKRDDYFYPRGILHRENTGRSWAIRTPQMPMRWS